MSWVVAANVLGGVGSVISLFAHFYMGKKEFSKKTGFMCHIVACILILISASMLQSIPVFMLNLIWIGISYAGMKEISLSSLTSKFLIPVNIVLFAVSVVCLFVGEWTWAASLTVWIYVCAFILFSAQQASQRYYYGWCFLAFTVTIPHLFESLQYSVLAAEVIGGIISAHVFVTSFKNPTLDGEGVSQS